MPFEKEKLKTENSDGLVWINNGIVYVKNEDKYGMPPVINPCKEAVLYINGAECNHLCTLNEKDTVAIKPLTTKTDLQIDVELSEDKLKCYLLYTPACQIRHEIADMEPVNRLDIQTRQAEVKVEKTDKNRIIEFLKSKNII